MLGSSNASQTFELEHHEKAEHTREMHDKSAKRHTPYPGLEVY